MSYIDKSTPTDHTIHPIIKNRWSPREFSDTAVEQQHVNQILEAGRWAPSSYNRQPWTIIYGHKGDGVYERIFSCLDEFNQGWAVNAPLLMVAAYKKDDENGNENFHALHDLGAFSMSMSLQAQDLNIAMHQMAGIDFNAARGEFGLPDNYHVATGIAAGYYGGDVSDLNEKLQEQETSERKRKPITRFAFNGNFTNA